MTDILRCRASRDSCSLRPGQRNCATVGTMVIIHDHTLLFFPDERQIKILLGRRHLPSKIFETTAVLNGARAARVARAVLCTNQPREFGSARFRIPAAPPPQGWARTYFPDIRAT